MKQKDRTVKTKQQLVRAFMALLQEQPAPQIKVADITRRAKLDRGTFYRYFESKDALIEDCEEEVLNKIYLSRSDVLHSVMSVQDLQENQNIVGPILDTIAANLEMMDVLLNRIGDNHFALKFKTFLLDEGMATIIQYSNKSDNISTKQRELFVAAASSAIIGLVSLWSSQPNYYSREDIEEVINRMITKGFFGII